MTSPLQVWRVVVEYLLRPNPYNRPERRTLGHRGPYEKEAR